MGGIPDIVKLKAGDEKSFRELTDHYRDHVFNTALGLLQNHENAEDVSQEVFIEVFRSVARFRGECTLSTWIYRITVQKALESLRTAKRRKRSGIMLSIFGREEHLNLEAEARFCHPGVKLENKERATILFAAIKQLPVSQQTAFILHKVEGLSQSEIAGIMETTVSSVESLIVRARKRLRDILSGYYEKNER